jgi:hypothetical protein
MSQSTYRRELRKTKAKAAAAYLATKTRADLEAKHGQVWNDEELERDFLGCLQVGPLALVVRREDCVGGSLSVQDEPRPYHSFVTFHDE